MKTLLTLLVLLTFNQDFDPNKYLNGKWCEGKNKECFYFTYSNGLMFYEIPDGGFKSGVESIKYDIKQNRVYWRIVGTTKKTQYFQILKDKKYVEYFDGNKTKRIRKYPKE
jgi:hypothetical protein|tara:strand:- start:2031 stop:2363 length:333 start_codon:yes stop_codon:yes gene_type:complete